MPGLRRELDAPVSCVLLPALDGSPIDGLLSQAVLTLIFRGCLCPELTPCVLTHSYQVVGVLVIIVNITVNRHSVVDANHKG